MSCVYSFDIFDTVLTRPLLRPSSLFHVVGDRLARDHPGRFTSMEYHAARRRAEQNARTAAQPRDDCHFEDVYASFVELALWRVARVDAMAVELATERDFLRPIAATIEKIRSLSSAGEKVVFLSDMYLPRTFIQELLREHVMDVSPEQIFVSGEIGLSKHTGRLYLHVLDVLGVEPGEFFHMGDNLHSDVAVPRRLGIQARAYTDVQPNRYERLPRPRRRAPLWLVGAGGVARATRLATRTQSEREATIARLACNVVAPLLTAYVAWVLRDARQRGVERLFFVSRDGQIFHKIAQELRRDGDPDCRYLYGSRQAWFLPAVSEPDLESLEWAWLGSMSRTGEAILRRLEIDTAEVRAVLDRKGFAAADLAIRLDEEQLERFQTCLLAEPIVSYIRGHAASRRSVAIAYLRQEGLFQDASWALVDVGWSLRSQRALSRILAAGGRNKEVRGYYMGVGHGHISLTETGPVHAFFTPPDLNLPSPQTARWFFRAVLLTEHLFTVADHPTARGYRDSGGRIEPVFGEDDRSIEVLSFARSMHEATCHYARELAASPLVDPTSTEFQVRGASLMREFCLWPERADVSGIAWLPTNKDQSHDTSLESRLASPLTVMDLATMVRHVLSRPGVPFFSPRMTWLMGSAAISGPAARILCRALYALYVLKQVRPRFTAGKVPAKHCIDQNARPE